MTNPKFKVGDSVLVSDGAQSDVPGTVLGVLPDPKGLGRDMFKVRLKGDSKQIISITVPASQLRPG